jgi:hypothetical protein
MAKRGLDGQSKAKAVWRLETICGDEQRLGRAESRVATAVLGYAVLSNGCARLCQA